MKKLVYYVLMVFLTVSITYSQDLLLNSSSYNSNGIVFSDNSTKVYVSFGRSIVGVAKSGNMVISVNSSKHFQNKGKLITNSGALDVVPNKFSLQQNYPNPFNPSTNIKYDIPKQSLVNISIYNILGEKVVELLNEVKSAGSYEMTWNAHNLSNGVYVYTMRGSDFVDSKKLILLK